MRALPRESAQGEVDDTTRVRRMFRPAVHHESGKARTNQRRRINVAGFPVMVVDSPFFLDLGRYGRRCVTCHETK